MDPVESDDEYEEEEEGEEDYTYTSNAWNSRNFYLGPLTEANPFDLLKEAKKNSPESPKIHASDQVTPKTKLIEVHSIKSNEPTPPLKKIKKKFGMRFFKKKKAPTEKDLRKTRIKRRKKLEKQKFKRLKKSIQFRAKKTLDIISSNEVTFIKEIHKDQYSIIYESKYKNKKVATKIFTFNVVEEPLKICYFNHPYLLKIYGMYLNKSKTSPQVGLVMEWCENRDLKTYFEKNYKKLRFLDKLDLIKKIGEAIGYLHSNGYIVEELKSKSILLTKNLNPKLSIYALSQLFKHQSEDNSKNQNSYFSISRSRKDESMSYYRAPEIILAKTYTSAVDVFSFGYIIFEIFFENFNPFNNEKLTEKFDNLDLYLAIEQDLRPKLNLDVVPDEQLWLVELLVQCWSFKEIDRPYMEGVVKTLIDEKKKMVMSEFAKSVTEIDDVEVNRRKEIRAKLMGSVKAKEMYFARPFFKGDYKSPEKLRTLTSTDSTTSFDVPKISSKGGDIYKEQDDDEDDEFSETTSSMDYESDDENKDDSRLKNEEFISKEEFEEVKKRNVKILEEEKERLEKEKVKDRENEINGNETPEGFIPIPSPCTRHIFEDDDNFEYDVKENDGEVGEEWENDDEVGKKKKRKSVPILVELKKRKLEREKLEKEGETEISLPGEEEEGEGEIEDEEEGEGEAEGEGEIDITEITKHKRRVPPIPIPCVSRRKKKFYSSLPKELPSFKVTEREKYRLKRRSDIHIDDTDVEIDSKRIPPVPPEKDDSIVFRIFQPKDKKKKKPPELPEKRKKRAESDEQRPKPRNIGEKPILPLKRSRIIIAKPKLPVRKRKVPRNSDFGSPPSLSEKSNSSPNVLSDSKIRRKKRKKRIHRRPRSGQVSQVVIEKNFEKEKEKEKKSEKINSRTYWQKRRSMHPNLKTRNYSTLPQMYDLSQKRLNETPREESPRPPVPSRRGLTLKDFQQHLERQIYNSDKPRPPPTKPFNWFIKKADINESSTSKKKKKKKKKKRTLTQKRIKKILKNPFFKEKSPRIYSIARKYYKSRKDLYKYVHDRNALYEYRQVVTELSFDNGKFNGQIITIKNKTYLHGKGIYSYIDGSKYEGEFVKNKKEGNGNYHYSNRDSYEGEFKNNHQDGFGAYYFRNGSKYFGFFKEGMFDGVGVYLYDNGDIYEGDFVKHKRHGIGKLSKKKYTYCGEFKNSKREGFGIVFSKIKEEEWVGIFQNNGKKKEYFQLILEKMNLASEETIKVVKEMNFNFSKFRNIDESDLNIFCKELLNDKEKEIILKNEILVGKKKMKDILKLTSILSKKVKI